jgi:predicted ATPase
MKIRKLKIDKLYGYIDKEIDFNSDLTLLVGINGSGKTSILNIINWIIRPSLPHLCVTEFKTITLSFSFNKVDYEIKCTQLKTTLKYDIKTKEKTYNPLVVRFSRHPKMINNDELLRANLIENYQGLSPVEKEKETWDLISKFPNPTIIGLDRNLYTEESANKVYYQEQMKVRSHRKSSSPLDRVKEIVNREYRKRRNVVLNLTNTLKNHLMLSTFDGSLSFDSLSSGIRYKLTLTQIENAEKRVNDYFKNFEEKALTTNDQDTIKQYFSQLKHITKQYQTTPDDESVKLLYGLNANQFIKIRKLLTEFEKFETKSLKAMEEIQTYMETLNFFLKDSAKKILFREDTAEINFSTLDKHGNILTEYKDINFLSSGEQQILILFSYIAFNSGDGRVFIIDEPELSLHIKWQEDFLEKLDLITPKSTQLILATHSPILANNKKNKAITLLPYND